MKLRGLWLVIVLMAVSPSLRAATNPDWTTNHAPFRMIGNLYYVGSKDLASYLVVTPEGDILINSNLASSPPQIRANVEALGFHWRDVKVLLISHAHADHTAGSAAILRQTGAKYAVMEGDVPVVESGGQSDWFFGGKSRYPAAKVDRVLHDGDEVRLVGAVLTAHLTAGHTKGCTTWTMQVMEAGKRYDVVIVGSTSVLSGYRLHDDPKYPSMAANFIHTYAVLRSLPCDVFLGSHGQFFELDAKYARLQAGDRLAFVDPAGYKAFVAARQREFEAELARQRGGKP